MPLLRNKYQPYIPDPDAPNNYNCDSAEYCHPINLGDRIKTQFYQTPCGSNLIDDPTFSDITLGAELMTDGVFTTDPVANWTLTGNWVWDTVDSIDHTPNASTDTATQAAVGIVNGNYYQLSVVASNISAGQVFIIIGGTTTVLIDANGTTTVDVLGAIINTNVVIQASADFTGSIESISLKLITFGKWNPNGVWDFADGKACKTLGGTGVLLETVSNYITVGGYYKITFEISDYVQGTLTVNISDIAVGTISANGIYTFWTAVRPTITGVVYFTPSTSFIGCIELPELFELRDDYSGELVNQDTLAEYDLAPFFTYFEDWVTLDFEISLFEVQYDCYFYRVYDACLISGNELVADGDFALGDFTDWTRNNGAHQYAIVANQLQLIFDPLGGESDIVIDGDFASGAFAPNWVDSGGGWAVVGNKARHTAGNTDTLTQSIVIAAPPVAPAVEFYWVQYTISNWTTGTITCSWGNGTSASFGANEVITQQITPVIIGSVDLVFTPSSSFDGDIDDIVLIASNTLWSSAPFIRNVVNLDIVNGNYQISLDIKATTDSRITVGMALAGQAQSVVYYSAVGIHQTSITNYVVGGQRAGIIADFLDGSNYVTGTITVDDISAIRVEPFDATYTSECLNFKLSHNRTKMLVAHSDNPAFGFEFENTGFTLQQRVVVRSIAPFYPTGKQIQKSGTGDGMVVYAEVEKYWQLHTDFASETFHDAMAVMVNCDHFLIGETEDNGIEYLTEAEDYSPQWLANGSYSLAPAVITLRVKDKAQLFNRHL